ncbi:MAG: hypothetical protein PVF43_12815, partial [Candidatus Eiseniibacteriota bacterium]
MRRVDLLETLAARIDAVVRPHPLRVAIDGVDGAGKTVLADALVAPLGQRGRPVIRAGIDGFHRPRRERLARGAESAAGYYHDSFDHEALRAALLDPLGPDGSRRYRRACFDYRSDRPLAPPLEIADPRAVLLFDGVFLQRPELRDGWDLVVFVHAPFEVSAARARARDLSARPDVAAERGEAARRRLEREIERRYAVRYVPGQELYLDACRPRERADLVVVNTDPAAPEL